MENRMVSFPVTLNDP